MCARSDKWNSFYVLLPLYIYISIPQRYICTHMEYKEGVSILNPISIPPIYKASIKIEMNVFVSVTLYLTREKYSWWCLLYMYTAITGSWNETRKKDPLIIPLPPTTISSTPRLQLLPPPSHHVTHNHQRSTSTRISSYS